MPISIPLYLCPFIFVLILTHSFTVFKYCIYLENLPKKCTRNFANLNIKNQPKANSLESMSHSLMTKFLLNWVCWIWIRTETNADPQHSLHGTGYLTRSKIYFIFVFYVRWGRRLPTYYVELEVDRPLLHLQRPLSSLPRGCCPAGQKRLLSSRPRRPPSSWPRRLPTSRPKCPPSSWSRMLLSSCPRKR